MAASNSHVVSHRSASSTNYGLKTKVALRSQVVEGF
jgi:hypothetical protein